MVSLSWYVGRLKRFCSFCYKFLVEMSASEPGAGLAYSVEAVRRVTGRDPIRLRSAEHIGGHPVSDLLISYLQTIELHYPVITNSSVSLR